MMGEKTWKQGENLQLEMARWSPLPQRRPNASGASSWWTQGGQFRLPVGDTPLRTGLTKDVPEAHAGSDQATQASWRTPGVILGHFGTGQVERRVPPQYHLAGGTPLL